MTHHWYCPCGMKNVVLNLSFGVIPIFQKPLFKSNLLKKLLLPIFAKSASFQGNGYLIGNNALFNAL
jgi:hypothetical protein